MRKKFRIFIIILRYPQNLLQTIIVYPKLEIINDKYQPYFTEVYNDTANTNTNH